MSSILDDPQFEAKIKKYRRDFHKYAEVKWTEFRTASMVAEYLTALGIPIAMGEEISKKGCQFAYPDEKTILAEIERAVSQGGSRDMIGRMDGLPGVVGTIETGRAGPVVAFRFDMDALPMIENDSREHYPAMEGFRSVNEGYCHACGHDGHTAIGLGLAEVLMERADRLSGRIKLIFQPAEEGGGGAVGIVERGLLDDVTHFFAVHVGLTTMEGLPLGNHGLICGVNDFLDSRRYNFTFIGRAAHAAGDPHMGKNALLASSSAALGIHSIAPHSEGALRLNVGVLRAGSARNIVPEEAYMEVDIRSQNDIVAEYAEERVLSVVKGAAEMYGNGLQHTLIGKTLAAASDDEAANYVFECAEEIGWFTDIQREGSVGGSDDASEMLRRVQKKGGIGTYIGLGSDFAAGFHNGAFDFDEAVMLPSIELLAAVAEHVAGSIR